MSRLLPLVTILLAASRLCAADLKWDDLRTWKIYVAKDAIPSEQYAAEEFQSLAKQALGFPLPIVAVTEPSEHGVCIGPSALPAPLRKQLEAEKLGDEGCFIKISPSMIAIAGGRPRGTLYAVYEFWERYAGVRFLTHDHTHVPKLAKNSAIPCGRYVYKPPFSFRCSSYHENRDHPEFAARLRNDVYSRAKKLGGITPQHLIGHSYCRLVPVDKYGHDHPEYFALYHSERPPTGVDEPQICVSNPEVVDIVTKEVLEQIETHPELGNVVVSQNDNQRYCQCEKCEAINRREGSPMAANLTFVNAVAERVAKVHPEVKVGTLAYQYTRKLPKTIRPRDNVQIQLCSIECCTRHAINDPNCPKNRAFMKDLKAWTDVTDNVYMWNYNTNFSNLDLPFPNLRGIGDTVKCFADRGVRGVYMQANGVSDSGEMSDLRNYVISRCLWHPGLDSWDVVEEFCRLHYGKAADTILEYLTFMHDNVRDKGLHPICFSTASELGITPEVAEKAVQMFAKALALAENDAVRRRVEKASLAAYKAVISTHGELHFDDDGLCRIKLPDGVAERYLTLLDRYNVTMMTEKFTAKEFVKQLKMLLKGIPYVAVENNVWRVAVVPELNGRVLALVYKPTGRNLLLARNRLFTRARGLEERGKSGHVTGQTSVPVVTGHVEDNVIHLTKTLNGDATVDRQIWFEGPDDPWVHFKTTVHQTGKADGWHQFGVHPEYDTRTTASDSSVLGIYVKDDRWRELAGPFDMDRGKEDEVTKFRGGEFAFFNHEAGFGVVQRFKPDTYENLAVWWRPERYQLNLDMMTRRFDLKPGESHSFGYAIGHLDAPPIPR